MDVILSKKPNNKLENVDHEIKTYIELLEKKLKHFYVWEEFNSQFEKKYLDLQEELFLLKSKNEELKARNIVLEEENKNIKLQITRLQLENDKLQNKSSNTNKKLSTNEASAVVSASDGNPHENCILIKGFTELQLQMNRKKNIIILGRYMNIKLSDSDIVSVSFKEREFYKRNNIQPQNTLLIVQFRSADLKVEFLKNKGKLKEHDHVADIEIADYVTDEVYNLYEYAKILKSHGYNIIYWRNNNVYVKKIKSNLCEPILIKSTTDVDNLKKK